MHERHHLCCVVCVLCEITIMDVVLRVRIAWARYTIIANREFIITASALCVTLPLSLYRNISRLVKVRAHTVQQHIMGFFELV